MPRSVSLAIYGFVLALAADWATAPAALAQAKPDKAMETILNEVEAAERRRLTILESLKRDQEQRAIERQKVAERNAADPRRRRPAPPLPADEPPAQAMVVVRESDLDLSIFGNVESLEARRYRLERLLAKQIEQGARNSPMTDAQKTKLALAGKGDIKKFFDRVEGVHQRCGGAYVMTVDEEVFRGLQGELQALRTLCKDGPFGDGSLFAKALRTIREREQAARRGNR
jgi:hypothetical protein